MRLREQACDIPAPISRKASVRQEVVRLDIIDELPGTIRNEQIPTAAGTHPVPSAFPESTAVRINCGGAVLEVMNGAGTEVIRAALLAVRGLC